MVYIQSNNERTFTHHFDCACALYGAIDNALDYRLTTFDEVVSGKFDALIRSNLFVGSTEFMTTVFRRIGLTDVRLPRNSNRNSEIITLGEAYRRQRDGQRLFIKPVELKLFTGMVLEGFVYSCLEQLPKDTKVMAYAVFPHRLVSEWRVYVDNHALLDSRNYSGVCTISPDYTYVRRVIAENKADFPATYTIDIGVMETGENVVVEFNDMWAIGNYGMANDLYLNALKRRYFDIIKNAKTKIGVADITTEHGV